MSDEGKVLLIINVQKYEPGTALAADLPVVTCPVCGRSAAKDEGSRAIDYVHEYQIVRERGAHGVFRSVQKATAKCRWDKLEQRAVR